MNYNIRVACLEDSKAIDELSIQLGYPADFESTQTRLKNILDRSDNCVFVATNQDQVIGWIHGFYAVRVETDPFVEIGGLVVDHAFQGKGVGKQLILALKEWSSAQLCSNIRVRCNTKRTKAHLFYRRMGFILQKEQKIFNLPTQNHSRDRE